MTYSFFRCAAQLNISTTLLLVFGIMPFAASGAATSAKPVVHYTFDEGGESVVDHSSRDNGGTLYGAAALVPVEKGYALELDGRTSFAKCAHYKQANLGTNGFTVDLWLNLDLTAGGTIIGKKGQAAESPGWLLRYDAAEQRLVFDLADGQNHRSTTVPYAKVGWHHISVVRHGDTVSFYIDGVLASKDDHALFAADLSNEQVFLHLGKVIGYTSVKGLLDDVVIWPTALNEQAVGRRYQSGLGTKPEPPGGPEPLLVHYTFDDDRGEQVVDQSSYRHDAVALNVEHFAELDGRTGVARLDGESAFLKLGQPESLKFTGDMTIEMWIRRHKPVSKNWEIVFGEYPARSFYLVHGQFHTLTLFYRDLSLSKNMHLATDPDLIDDQWAHVAVVVEYPRCRFYRNGELVRDAYMPLEGMAPVTNDLVIGGSDEHGHFPMDLDEFRWYRRALSPEEIATRASGNELDDAPSHKLAADVHWYEQTVTLRLDSKNVKLESHDAEFTLRDAEGGTVFADRARIREAYDHAGRYIASVAVPLDEVEYGIHEATVRVLDPQKQEVAAVDSEVVIAKPDWVYTQAGHSDTVPAPWQPVQARNADSQIALDVWARQYIFSDRSLIERIVALDDDLLASPVTMNASAADGEVKWSSQQIKRLDTSERAVMVEQRRQSSDIVLTVQSTTEFDGYIIFDCQLEAQRDVTLNGLTVDVPLRSEYAALCYGDCVLPPVPGIGISEWYSGAVEGDLAFRFGPTIWLGNHDRGLVWQSETNVDWRNADPDRAIEILPRDAHTTLRAHFIDIPTRLKRGDSLSYKFAIQAMPIKPMGRDAWDLRIMRSGPYGNELHLPDRAVGDKPILDYLADAGVRYFFYQASDQWPHPTIVAERFGNALRRLIDSTHESGMKIHPYLLHQRYPVVVPEYDVHGAHMALGPHRAYLSGMNPPSDDPSSRPGPIPMAWGAGAQGCVFACPKSEALQDSYIHSLAERMSTYNEDGVYLDGTVHVPPCNNEMHGCGYRDPSGELHATYPVFAVRRYLQRIAHVVKERNPENIVDIHCSWGYNPSALAYGDMMWTGEQWHHLRHEGAEHIPDELPLAMFRTEFTGHQIGIGADSLSYRLGSTMKMAAVSLLHDIPVRLNQGGQDPLMLAGAVDENEETAPSGSSAHEEQIYFKRLTKLWRVRDDFGADDEAKKFFYWENDHLVQLAPEDCYALLFVHPDNGLLALVSNLSRENHDVHVKLNLEQLGLSGYSLDAFDVFSEQTVPIDAQGAFTVPLGSTEWTYIRVPPARSE